MYITRTHSDLMKSETYSWFWKQNAEVSQKSWYVPFSIPLSPHMYHMPHASVVRSIYIHSAFIPALQVLLSVLPARVILAYLTPLLRPHSRQTSTPSKEQGAGSPAMFQLSSSSWDHRLIEILPLSVRDERPPNRNVDIYCNISTLLYCCGSSSSV